MNNIFVTELAKDSVASSPDITPTKFVVEDNIGEAIHVHLRNLRLDMTVEDFLTFAASFERAFEEFENGNR